MVTQVPIGQIIEDLGLPADSRFRGYVVHRPGRDDFVAVFNESNAIVQRGYVPDPEFARKYDYFPAVQVAESIGAEAEVWICFETEEQFYVHPVSD